jgi:CheY-like chemotaxis protein
MATVLVCTGDDLEPDLQGTILWRQEVERYIANRADEARMLAHAAEPDVIVVDRDMPGADELLASFRQERFPRSVSIVVLTREPVDDEPDLAAAAILTMPPGPGWDDPLFDLMHIPRRTQLRYAVKFDVETWHQLTATAARAVALNLSLGGMLLECRWRFRLGDDLDLRLLLPDAGSAIVGCGTVIRDAAPRQFGMQFRDLAGDGAERIERFLAAHAA